ncbi:hypothetical protein SAMN04488073_1275 [Marinobacter gudaonensis]|uniref:Amino acid transport protein n=1 Tax=Marinobacter gudaonensis TaxID=375760 RepID=A0A1I6GPC8_9GAMM|nr:hypothetical protein [Marinobacter gudaonensis]SFR44050.1 hypothetical protein SAMN04488073_1275 [Marinobacter gudaonensis]
METANIILALIFGCIGLAYFMYGRRQKHMVARYCGIGMALYPYLAGSPWEMLTVGLVLMLVPRFVEV